MPSAPCNMQERGGSGAIWQNGVAQWVVVVGVDMGFPWSGVDAAAGTTCWRSDCKQECLSKVRLNLKAISEVLQKQYGITHIARDLVRYDLLQPDPTQKGTRYKIAGVPVCFHALRSIIGVGPRTAHRIQEARMDARFTKREAGCTRVPERRVWSKIYSFLWNVYMSVAECMPDEGLVVNANPFVETPRELQKSIQACWPLHLRCACLLHG